MHSFLIEDYIIKLQNNSSFVLLIRKKSIILNMCEPRPSKRSPGERRRSADASANRECDTLSDAFDDHLATCFTTHIYYGIQLLPVSTQQLLRLAEMGEAVACYSYCLCFSCFTATVVL